MSYTVRAMTSENPDPRLDRDAPPAPRDAAGWLAALGEAAAFFTRLPIGGAPPRYRLADTLPVVPVVGVAIGLAAGIDLAIARGLGASSLLAAAVGVLTAVVITGALHEDGLADTIDAFGAPGAVRTRRLEILRDSRIGVFGALALMFSLLFRVAALAQIVDTRGALAALLALAAAHALSRAALGWTLWSSPPARADGLSAGIGAVSQATAGWTLGVGGAIAFVCLVWVTPLVALLAPPLAVAIAAGTASVARERVGGHTGDTLGATQQFVEIAILILVALAVGLGARV